MVTGEGTPPALRVGAWREIPRLVHGFFGRRGGTSSGPWRSLNVSDAVGDDPRSVAANWSRASLAVPSLPFVRVRQVHGVRVLRADGAERPLGEADGMVASAAGLGLAILTADCVPILCVAPATGTVMALHAGWRGTLGGIAAAGLHAARDWLGVAPDAWQVALGPSIGGCCYQVEAQIGEDLVHRWGAMPDAWQRSGSHGQLDLRGANRAILEAHGVPARQIITPGPCTACQSSEYFSHRRSGGRTGRQLSVIGWAG
jgi:hypothetical protein